jgi:hypothetical protein
MSFVPGFFGQPTRIEDDPVVSTNIRPRERKESSVDDGLRQEQKGRDTSQTCTEAGSCGADATYALYQSGYSCISQQSASRGMFRVVELNSDDAVNPHVFSTFVMTSYVPPCNTGRVSFDEQNVEGGIVDYNLYLYLIILLVIISSLP